MHLTTITAEAKKLLPKFKRFPQFTLVGGTSLALQLGHRKSVDLDWFTEKSLPRNLHQQVLKVFGPLIKSPEVKNNRELTLEIDGVKVTFFSYAFVFSQQPIIWQGLPLAGVADIGVMKAYIFGQRITFRDYVDLYFILKSKAASLDWIINKTKKIYKDQFHARLFLEQILNPEDIPAGKIDFLQEPVSKEQIRKFFENLVKTVKI